MNDCQKLWWEQTKSDHAVLLILRRTGVAACHQLHYLQMVTEKLGKAYFWRSGQPSPKVHTVFVKFLRALGQTRSPDRQRIADIFQFRRFTGFQTWIHSILPLAYELQSLAPALAQDNGPNPEYPWPHLAPRHAPVTFEFDVWTQLSETGQGRQLLHVIDTAVREFPRYA